ncbi:MAG: pyridoxamine 5'-phosphate oxidase family protein [Ilumatobacteraceae bacterium]|nr:pyridoxamine 5'-phosphate oxidase family protein [Ilumatobacteraceae bacterium]
MSIPVEIEDLQAATDERGFAYLLTVRDSQTPHVVAVDPQWADSQLVMSVGRGTAANARSRSTITLCYPPADDDGYSLIVDGSASVDADDVLTFAPTGAVLHRPAAPGATGATGCSNDCLPVGSD